MTVPAVATVAMLGLPRTGKTTYLGALWQIVQDREAPYVLEADLQGDRGYLQQLADCVASAEEVPRTSVDSSDALVLSLTFESSGRVDLRIPDLSGEVSHAVVTRRRWTRPLWDAVSSSSGLLVFVHPHRLAMPATIASANNLLADAATSGDDQTLPSPFSLDDDACTAAMYVDLLENVRLLRPDRTLPSIALMISAWDLVEAESSEIAPKEWLEARMPLLAQYLDANNARGDLGVFGVSAQGGELDDRAHLLAMGDVCARARVVSADGSEVRFTRPLELAIWGTSDP